MIVAQYFFNISGIFQSFGSPALIKSVAQRLEDSQCSCFQQGKLFYFLLLCNFWQVHKVNLCQSGLCQGLTSGKSTTVSILNCLAMIE
jgi:hypothetical protein